jgi:hypothetical protein
MMKNAICYRSLRASEALHDACDRVEELLRARPNVDVPLPVVLGQRHADERSRLEAHLGYVEPPPDAVAHRLVASEPVANAEAEEFRDTFPLGLRTRPPFLEIARRGWL